MARFVRMKGMAINLDHVRIVSTVSQGEEIRFELSDGTVHFMTIDPGDVEDFYAGLEQQ